MVEPATPHHAPLRGAFGRATPHSRAEMYPCAVSDGAWGVQASRDGHQQPRGAVRDRASVDVDGPLLLRRPVARRYTNAWRNVLREHTCVRRSGCGCV